MDRNRREQLLQRERDRANRYLVPSLDATGGRSNPSRIPREVPPCILFQTDTCQRPNCRYAHKKIGPAEFEALKKRREEYLSEMAAKGKGTSNGKGSSKAKGKEAKGNYSQEKTSTTTKKWEI